MKVQKFKIDKFDCELIYHPVICASNFFTLKVYGSKNLVFYRDFQISQTRKTGIKKEIARMVKISFRHAVQDLNAYAEKILMRKV